MRTDCILWQDARCDHVAFPPAGLFARSFSIETPMASMTGHLIAPDRPLRLSELLPAARAMTDSLVESVLDHLWRTGQSVSCQAGCANCCKQFLIPLAPPEAADLWAQVENLPPDPREKYTLRFLAALQKLSNARPFTPSANRSPDRQLEELSSWYAELNLGCPFLDDGLCSIYADRPLACREYLVTSPPHFCKGHHPTKGYKVPMPVSIAEAVFQLAAELDGTDLESVILTMMPMWNYENPHRIEQTYPAREIIEGFVTILNAQADSANRAAIPSQAA